jgi:tungstate transport system ATP-binding protein
MSYLINLQNISYVINDKYILRNIDYAIDNEGVLAILGPNGAGKTTLLKLIANLIKPTSGIINYNYKMPIGFVFQRPVLLNRSVEDNLIHALKYSINTQNKNYKKIIKNILDENDLLHLLKESAKKLSGGEQQLISILRACVIEPEILFFDEPTSNLDKKYKKLIETLILQISKKIKVIMISQDHVMANNIANKLLFLEKGAVIN